MKTSIVTLIFLILMIPHPGFSQDSGDYELEYGVYRNYPPISMTKQKISKTHTLIDLNSRFQSSWIREYHSVEILTQYQGKIIKAVSKNDTLSQEQIDDMLQADLGSDISVIVHYTPENTLQNNETKLLDFKLSIDPENDAIYPGGSQKMNQYLKENLVDKMPSAKLKQYQLAAATFTVDAEGFVTDPKIFWSSEDEILDALLIETICNMPNWMPAEFSNGTNVKQEFVLTLGDMQSCVVPLLNIRLNQ